MVRVKREKAVVVADAATGHALGLEALVKRDSDGFRVEAAITGGRRKQDKRRKTVRCTRAKTKC